jgi:signal peptidase I
MAAMPAAALGIACALGLAVIVAALVARRRFTVITVRGPSMTPTYANGDRVLVRRTTTFSRDDVMVFAMPEDQRVDGMRWLVKRVTAVAGDGVPADVRALVGEGRVPRGCVIVRGDGSRSLDSRQLGYIATADGLGIVIRRLR